MSCAIDELELIAWLDGETTENRSLALARHAAECADCAVTVAALRRIRHRVKAPEAVDGDELLARLAGRLEREAGPPRATRRRRTVTWAVAAGGVSAAAAAALWIVPRIAEPTDLRARGAPMVLVGQGLSPSRVAATIYRAPRGNEGASVLRDGDVVPASRGLAFRITNRHQFAVHLMLAGVDAAGVVHWFYPAWDDPSSDPEALVIPADTTSMALPDAVVPEGAAPGRMRILTLVSRSSLHVREVERRLAEGRPPAELVHEVVVELEKDAP